MSIDRYLFFFKQEFRIIRMCFHPRNRRRKQSCYFPRMMRNNNDNLTIRYDVIDSNTCVVLLSTLLLALSLYYTSQNDNAFVPTGGTTVVLAMMLPNYSFRNAERIAPFGFPDSSKTIPQPSRTNTNMDPDHQTIVSSRCSCGSVLVEFPYPKPQQQQQQSSQNLSSSSSSVVSPPPPSIIDCHCPTCRRYHMAAIVRYMEVSDNDISVAGDSVVRYEDTCAEWGNVQRIYCRRCSTKLLTKRSTTTTTSASSFNNGRSIRSMPPLQQRSTQSSSSSLSSSATNGQSTVLVNMGPIDNKGLPKEIIQQWKDTYVHKWRSNMEVSWATITAKDIEANDNDNSDSWKPPVPKPVKVTGGCTCGKCQYEFDFTPTSEMQHCYCNLCRQLSGGMFMTWVPVNIKEHNFRWINNSNNNGGSTPAATTSTMTDYHQFSSLSSSSTMQNHQQQQQQYTNGGDYDNNALQFVRYTDIGKRHMCTQCGSNLSILYDTYVYDDDDDDDEEDRVIWLAAGGFDSIRFPFHVAPYISRLLHICCRFKPKWYQIPDDGIPRVKDAS